MYFLWNVFVTGWEREQSAVTGNQNQPLLELAKLWPMAFFLFASYHSLGTTPSYHSLGTTPSYHSLGTTPSYHSLGTRPSYHSLGTRPSWHQTLPPSSYSITLIPCLQHPAWLFIVAKTKATSSFRPCTLREAASFILRHWWQGPDVALTSLYFAPTRHPDSCPPEVKSCPINHSYSLWTYVVHKSRS